ncbi:MAG: hypothetical protein ACLFR5_06360 [Halobacteriales archaeon]
MTGIEVKEADLSDEEVDGDDGIADEDRTGDDGRHGVLGTVFDLAVRVLRIVVSVVVGYNVSQVRRRLRLLGFLALGFLVFGFLASVVWLLVGVAFLIERFPAAADPLVFAAGGVVGYLVAVVAGLVYSR